MRHARLQKLQRFRREWPFYVLLFGHGFIGYPKGRNVERALGFSLTGTVSTSPNLAKEGARSATIITRPSGSRFS